MIRWQRSPSPAALRPNPSPPFGSCMPEGSGSPGLPESLESSTRAVQFVLQEISSISVLYLIHQVDIMKLEIMAATELIVRLFGTRGRQEIPEHQLQMFKSSLGGALRRRFRDHWFPEDPIRGNAYRCLRINGGRMDPTIAKAAKIVGLEAAALRKLLPCQLAVWIDPAEVSYRIGDDHGSIGLVYMGIPEIIRRPSSSLSSSSTDSSSSGLNSPQPSQAESCLDSLMLENEESQEFDNYILIEEIIDRILQT